MSAAAPAAPGAAAGVLVPRRAAGWRMGLANMLGKELAAWWRVIRRLSNRPITSCVL